MSKFIEYFTNLNSAGQALFVVGTLLVLTFIILLIIVLKPEKKAHKVYSENEDIDREEIFEKRLKDIDNINTNDINIENDKTRNLLNIVDELKGVEKKEYTREEIIERYEKDEENTAVISLDELLGNKPLRYEPKKEAPTSVVYEKREVITPERAVYQEKTVVKSNDFDDDFFIDDTPTREEMILVKETVKPKREVFSSVFSPNEEPTNEEFLNSLKDFRNNLN